MVVSPEAVVSGTIGDRLAGQTQRLGRRDGQRWRWLAAPGENVQDDIGGMDAFAEGFGAGCLYGFQAVGQNGAEDVDHLAVAVADASDDQLADSLQDDLNLIADQLAEWGAKPTKEGYAPKGWYERANATRSMYRAESVVRLAEGRARAIRQEQADRAGRAKAAHEAAQADVQARLEGILRDAPAEAERALAHAQGNHPA